MGIIEIDTARCTRCSLCLRICPQSAIVLDEQGFPTVTDGRLCISCGHCVSVCPEQALSLSGTDPAAYEELPASLPDAATIRSFLLSRRSTRLFRDSPLPEQLILQLVETGARAPSANNFQKRGFIVITDPAVRDRLEIAVVGWYRRLLALVRPWMIGLIRLFSSHLAHDLADIRLDIQQMLDRDRAGQSPIFRRAPCVIITHAPKSNPSWLNDCQAAQYYMIFMAHALGLGTCEIGYVDLSPGVVQRALGLPRGQRIGSVLIVGYPVPVFHRTVARRAPELRWIGPEEESE